MNKNNESEKYMSGGKKFKESKAFIFTIDNL